MIFPFFLDWFSFQQSAVLVLAQQVAMVSLHLEKCQIQTLDVKLRMLRLVEKTSTKERLSPLFGLALAFNTTASL